MKRFNSIEFFTKGCIDRQATIGDLQHGYMVILWPVMKRDYQKRIRDEIPRRLNIKNDAYQRIKSMYRIEF